VLALLDMKVDKFSGVIDQLEGLLATRVRELDPVDAHASLALGRERPRDRLARADGHTETILTIGRFAALALATAAL
jgi:hypothetical protein